MQAIEETNSQILSAPISSVEKKDLDPSKIIALEVYPYTSGVGDSAKILIPEKGQYKIEIPSVSSSDGKSINLVDEHGDKRTIIVGADTRLALEFLVTESRAIQTDYRARKSIARNRQDYKNNIITSSNKSKITTNPQNKIEDPYAKKPSKLREDLDNVVVQNKFANINGKKYVLKRNLRSQIHEKLKYDLGIKENVRLDLNQSSGQVIDSSGRINLRINDRRGFSVSLDQNHNFINLKLANNNYSKYNEKDFAIADRNLHDEIQNHLNLDTLKVRIRDTGHSNAVENASGSLKNRNNEIIYFDLHTLFNSDLQDIGQAITFTAPNGAKTTINIEDLPPGIYNAIAESEADIIHNLR